MRTNKTNPVAPFVRAFACAAAFCLSWADPVFAGGKFIAIDLTGGPTAESYPVTYLDDAGDYANDGTYKTNALLLKSVVSTSFTNYVGVFEVTQKQYERVMGTNPSFFSGGAEDPMRPVEKVAYATLTDVNGFFSNLCKRTNLKLFLPTQAQWEAAARGQMPLSDSYNLGSGNYKPLTKTIEVEPSEGPYYYSDAEKAWLPHMGRYGELWTSTGVQPIGSDATYREPAYGGTAIVGSYTANDNGLYDMHGNVAEWTCADTNGTAVLRGGSWQSTAAECAIGAVLTDDNFKGGSTYSTGFRVFGESNDPEPVSLLAPLRYSDAGGVLTNVTVKWLPATMTTGHTYFLYGGTNLEEIALWWKQPEGLITNRTATSDKDLSVFSIEVNETNRDWMKDRMFFRLLVE